MLRIAMIYLLAVSCFALNALRAEPLPNSAAAPQATPETKGPEQNPTGVELSKPVVGPVHSARAMIGTEVHQAETPVGKVEDLSLDIGSGLVQRVYFRPIKPVDDKQATMMLPMSQFQWPEKEGPLTMLGNLLKTETDPKAAKNSPSKVIMLSKSASIRVLDGRGKPIGHIVDFALSHKEGQIAYAVLHLGHSDNEKDANIGKHEKVYPIPLAAFVVKDDSTDWILDLPGKMLDDIPSFKEDEAWPRVVAGTWTEYIHVRYGRSVLGGVQIEEKKFDEGGKTNPREGVKKQY
jgi:sporulation protein YlmC with PRC-barrel domain